MDVGYDIIGVVKTNTKGLCKDYIENITKDWPGVSYLVLKRSFTVPGNRPIIAIGSKYNSQKLIYFIDAYGAWSTKAVISHLYKYPELFSNVAIFPVACHISMSKLFGYVNEVY